LNWQTGTWQAETGSWYLQLTSWQLATLLLYVWGCLLDLGLMILLFSFTVLLIRLGVLRTFALSFFALPRASC
jgi:hypothetical protein